MMPVQIQRAAGGGNPLGHRWRESSKRPCRPAHLHLRRHQGGTMVVEQHTTSTSITCCMQIRDHDEPFTTPERVQRARFAKKRPAPPSNYLRWLRAAPGKH
uniref:Uncharacterized protein n=1 Tax=Arundo donax TaxID=35708 RepID=A0A0A9FVJ7_ARUDO